MTNYVNSIKHAARILQHKSQRNMNNTHTLTRSLCVGRGRSSKHTRYLVLIWSPLYGIITRLHTHILLLPVPTQRDLVSV